VSRARSDHACVGRREAIALEMTQLGAVWRSGLSPFWWPNGAMHLLVVGSQEGTSRERNRSQPGPRWPTLTLEEGAEHVPERPAIPRCEGDYGLLSGGGGIRTHGGPNGPQRFSSPCRTGRNRRCRAKPNHSGERLRERNLSEILGALTDGLYAGWDDTSARSRADVCSGGTREELIQHVAGPLELTRQRVRVAAKGDRRRTGLIVRRLVAHDLRRDLRLTPAWSSLVAAVCRASWSPIG
jgi:hypothetical protein